MKLAHLSDTHLGFAAYGRTAEGRLNQREVDVCKSFDRCLAAILERDPDVVIHSGDLFHVVRPSNYSLIYAYRTISKFQERRHGKPFVIIGGNHDTPQSAESVNILGLFSDIPGVVVQPKSATLVEFDQVSVLCVPHGSIASQDRVSWAPPKAPNTVLALHGLVDQTKLDHFDFELAETRPHEWTYVALGDWHVHQAYGGNVAYAGSTDFTSTNIWEEARQPKGWVWFDTEVGKLEFVPIHTRPVLDLPPIDALSLSGAALGEKLLEQAVWDEDLEPIVRQRVLQVTPELRREWPIGAIREIQRRALYYLPAQVAASEARTSLGARATITAESLESAWERHIDGIPKSGEVEKDELKRLGLELLQEVVEHETAPVEA